MCQSRPDKNTTAFLTSLICSCLFLCLFGFLPIQTTHARPTSIQALTDIMSKLLVTKIGYGEIPSLYRPRFDSVKNADLNMTKESIVFVVMLPDGPRIYPQSIMVWHQVVNELIDDHAYAITYCPTTGTLMAYDAGMNGLNLIFDTEGRLFDGNSVLIDRNSGSLWLQELGMAFDGPLLGRGLPTLPVFWTNWAAARKVFPDAKVMSNPPGNRPYGRDPYGNYLKKGTYYDNDILIYPLQRMDKRFHRKTPMLCLEIDGFLVGIDIGYVKKQGAVNFFLGKYAMLAVHDTQLDVVRVFERNIWADPFLFVKQYGKLMDLNTRSIWDAATGQSIEGNMRGAKLKQHYGGYSMWLAWYSMNPETLVIPGPGEVPSALLSTNKPGMDGRAQQQQMTIPQPQVTQPRVEQPVSPAVGTPQITTPASVSSPVEPKPLPAGDVNASSPLTPPTTPRAPVEPQKPTMSMKSSPAMGSSTPQQQKKNGVFQPQLPSSLKNESTGSAQQPFSLAPIPEPIKH